jgi:hypothetical protein
MAEPGDLVFAHSRGLFGRAIRFGEWMRTPWRAGSSFNHVAIVDVISDAGTVFVIQAEARGVTRFRTLDEVAPGGTIKVVAPPDHVDVDDMLTFARSQVGQAYGWATIASLVLDILTPGWFPAFRARGSWICSGLAGESLRCGGWVHQFDDVYQVTPAQLRLALLT